MSREPSVEVASDPPRYAPEDAGLMALVESTIAGDARAWQELWRTVHPMLWAITGLWRLVSCLCRSDEDRRNIVVRVMGQLHEDRFRRLRLFRDSCARRGESSFRAWLATVAARSAISYARAHRPAESIASLSMELPPADPTAALLGRDLLDRARNHLRADQLDALSLWLDGWDHAEIALKLGLGQRSLADQLVRSGLKRLRDRFAEDRARPGAVGRVARPRVRTASAELACAG